MGVQIHGPPGQQGSYENKGGLESSVALGVPAGRRRSGGEQRHLPAVLCGKAHCEPHMAAAWTREDRNLLLCIMLRFSNYTGS